MKKPASPLFRYAVPLAALLFAGLALHAGRIDGYSHAQHPVALLGARPLPDAGAFNVLGFIAPGLLVAWVVLGLRAALPPRPGGTARWSARIGAQLLLVSALAFAAQGALPLDAGDLDSARSTRHASAWTVWWIAFAAGGPLLALGLRGADRWRPLAALSLLAAPLLPVLALALPTLVAAGIAQRLAFALWFAWALVAGVVVNRARQP